MRDLLMKEAKFKWTNECQKALSFSNQLSQQHSFSGVRTQTKAFYLQCDACEYSVWAILPQKSIKIKYMSSHMPDGP